MKKVTQFLLSLLVLTVGLLVVLKYIGATGKTESAERVVDVQIPDVPAAGAGDNPDVLPEYYNCMDAGKVSRASDQGSLGSCWAFAVNSALESRLLPEEEWDFSEDHMLNNSGFGQDPYEGGDFFMALAYLSAWKGPVNEADDPYNDGITNENAEVVKHLQEAILLTDPDLMSIKRLIMEYGAVESSIYMAVNDDLYIDETFYDRYLSSYCYNGEGEANHEIVIIGWDDNYPSDNFRTGAYNNGAYICLNSWGTEFGNYGMFYVSYDDVRIAENIEVYSKLENADNYDRIYQNDDQGWVGRLGFDDSSVFIANAFTAKNDEYIKAAAFYATGEATDYTVYICEDFTEMSDLLTKRKANVKGHLTYPGYYTIELDEPVYISENERFAVIVEICTPGSNHPAAIEMDSEDGRTSKVITEGRESFISPNGINWSCTQKEMNCNVCLKVFTEEITE